ncbi:hypothetical protein QE320_gp137 [Pseudomonas phage EM]|uniref:Uncharacterized protein n=1 Tax=Pseudomonas phage EM TaxID=2936914 RepID=A0AAE9HHI6_9CAUD|nr:hypothetical protein QE320_gp137 [Pseudomonas phage EM]UPW35917.1 hypothetical protein EM_132 [Pseudomonas phage EM]
MKFSIRNHNLLCLHFRTFDEMNLWLTENAVDQWTVTTVGSGYEVVVPMDRAMRDVFCSSRG